MNHKRKKAYEFDLQTKNSDKKSFTKTTIFNLGAKKEKNKIKIKTWNFTLLWKIICACKKYRNYLFVNWLNKWRKNYKNKNGWKFPISLMW